MVGRAGQCFGGLEGFGAGGKRSVRAARGWRGLKGECGDRQEQEGKRLPAHALVELIPGRGSRKIQKSSPREDHGQGRGAGVVTEMVEEALNGIPIGD